MHPKGENSMGVSGLDFKNSSVEVGEQFFFIYFKCKCELDLENSHLTCELTSNYRTSYWILTGHLYLFHKNTHLLLYSTCM